ncbi:hypothetical protein BC826DRAFT_1064591, partial [Russula brevipes]
MELIECNFDVVEKGGINPSHEIPQVLGIPFEPKSGERGKDRACLWRAPPACSEWVETRSNGRKV